MEKTNPLIKTKRLSLIFSGSPGRFDSIRPVAHRGRSEVRCPSQESEVARKRKGKQNTEEPREKRFWIWGTPVLIKNVELQWGLVNEITQPVTQVISNIHFNIFFAKVERHHVDIKDQSKWLTHFHLVTVVNRPGRKGLYIITPLSGTKNIPQVRVLRSVHCMIYSKRVN